MAIVTKMGRLKNCEAPECIALTVEMDYLLGAAVTHVAVIL